MQLTLTVSFLIVVVVASATPNHERKKRFLGSVTRFLEKTVKKAENSANTVGNIVKYSAEDVGTFAGDSANKVGNFAGESADKVGNFAGDAVNTVGNFAGDAADKVGNFAGDAVNTIGNFAGDSADKVGNFAGDAVNTIGNFAGDAADKVGNFVDDTVRPVGPALEHYGALAARLTIKGVVGISKMVYKKAYKAARRRFEAIGEDIKDIDFDDVVDYLIELIDSDSSRCLCAFACKSAAGEIMGPLAEFVVGRACLPLCSGALAKIEDAAEDVAEHLREG